MKPQENGPLGNEVIIRDSRDRHTGQVAAGLLLTVGLAVGAFNATPASAAQAPEVAAATTPITGGANPDVIPKPISPASFCVTAQLPDLYGTLYNTMTCETAVPNGIQTDYLNVPNDGTFTGVDKGYYYQQQFTDLAAVETITPPPFTWSGGTADQRYFTALPASGLWEGEVAGPESANFDQNEKDYFHLEVTDTSAPVGPGLPAGDGYTMTAGDGGIFNFGNSKFYGSEGGKHLNKPIVGMASTPDGGGYWEVASDGGIFTFGDARFYGSEGAHFLNKPIVGMASTPDGKGYYLVASDGGIFTFGDAKFKGSTGGQHLNEPIESMTTNASGGYWLTASDGGIFTFGGAQFFGSEGGRAIPAPIVGIVASEAGDGYIEVDAKGNTYPFGSEAVSSVSLGSVAVNLAASHSSIVGVGVFPTGGEVLFGADGTSFWSVSPEASGMNKTPLLAQPIVAGTANG